ncbi:hypothetical protein ACFL0C_02045 [Patescibacteria group bacterium]
MVIFFSLVASFFGLQKLAKICTKGINPIYTFIISVWYVFNPYTLTLFHGGVYNIGSSLTYALAPTILFYFHKVFVENPKHTVNRDVVILAILLFFASPTFWLAATLAFFLAVYFLFNLIIDFDKTKFFEKLTYILRNTLKLSLLYFLLAGFIFFSIIYEFLFKTGYLSPFSSPVFLNLQGGLWYQFLLLFSWGIYTVWHPRHLYHFGDFFFSNLYKFGIFVLYFTPLLGFFLSSKNGFSKSKTKYFVVFLLTFIVFLFLAKAAQPPFGNIYLLLYEKVPFFKVFRSSDSRFGFLIILSITLMILSVCRFINKYLFIMLMIVVIGIQNIYMFNGEAIQGRDVKNKYFDRIVHISDEAQELSNFFNKQDSEFGYVISVPVLKYGHHLVDDNEHFVGQDILPNIINDPLIYISEGLSDLKTDNFHYLNDIAKSETFDNYANFPIKYILYREDVICEQCLSLDKDVLDIKLPRVFNNDFYTVYKIPSNKSIVEGSIENYEIVSPAKIKVSLSNDLNKNEKLLLNLSYNPAWKVYDDTNNKGFFRNVTLLRSKELSVNQQDLFRNSWEISENTPKNVILVYKPQLYFELLMVLSFLSLGIFIVYLLNSLRKNHAV